MPGCSSSGRGRRKENSEDELSTELGNGIAHIEPDVPHEQLTEWYRAMNVFVMPSRYENFSNAVLEALACGVPFLVSDVGGNRCLAETKGAGCFLPVPPTHLAQALRSIAENPRQARDRGTFGGERVRHRYSWEASAKRLEDIFQSCLDMKVGTECRL